MLSFIEDCWTRLKISFDVQDPIQPTGKFFEMPQSFHELDPKIKKTLTVCNLFANNNQSVEQIAEYFHVPKRQVIRILLGEGFLKEQRTGQQRAIRNGRRQSDRTNELAEIGPLHTSLS
jgi:hypothetical protein